jgi:hypothetical protein
MKAIIFSIWSTLLLAGCYSMSNHPATESSTTVPAPTKETAPSPSHDQQCSALRADIASAQHNQRTMAPATAAPIIAAASEGKEDQRIRALQERYAGLGCTGSMTLESSSPTH